LALYYRGKKFTHLFNKGKKYRITIDKTKEKPIVVLKPSNPNTEKEESNC